jgi:hypothetical protein
VSALRWYRAYLLHPHAYLRRYSRVARMFPRRPRLNGSHEGVDVKVKMRFGEIYGMPPALRVEARAPPTPLPPRVSSRGSALGSQSRCSPPVLALACASHHFPSKARVSYRIDRTESRRAIVAIWSTRHVVLFVIRYPSVSPVIRNSESRLVSIGPMIDPSSCSIPGNST